MRLDAHPEIPHATRSSEKTSKESQTTPPLASFVSLHQTFSALPVLSTVPPSLHAPQNPQPCNAANPRAIAPLLLRTPASHAQSRDTPPCPSGTAASAYSDTTP